MTGEDVAARTPPMRIARNNPPMAGMDGTGVRRIPATGCGFACGVAMAEVSARRDATIGLAAGAAALVSTGVTAGVAAGLGWLVGLALCPSVALVLVTGWPG